MLLVKFLNNLFKKGGFILEDAYGKEYIIGNPEKQNKLKIKIHNKKLHYKLLLYPDLYFGEAFTDNEISIENGSLSEFLSLAIKNIGRKETNYFSYFLNKLSGS